MKRSLLERCGLSLVVLPPLRTAIHPLLEHFETSIDAYQARLAEVQRFRGAHYLADGAITLTELDDDERHCVDYDHDTYHVLLVDQADSVQSCFRLRIHPTPVTATQLKLYEFVQRMETNRAARFVSAIEQAIFQANAESISFGEVGGWAVAPRLRHSISALVLPVAAWALYQIMGEALVLAAATERHGSSQILRGMGGFPLHVGGEPLESFFDPAYGCTMDLVGFDSRRPGARFSTAVAEVRQAILQMPGCPPPLKSATQQCKSVEVRQMSQNVE